jgi:hypothetical protein
MLHFFYTHLLIQQQTKNRKQLMNYSDTAIPTLTAQQPRMKLFESIVGPLNNKHALSREQRHAIVLQFSRILMQHDAEMRTTTLVFM